MNKFEIQDNQYIFPYHWIPEIKNTNGVYKISVSRELYWGFQYLCYMQYVAEKVLQEKAENILDVGCGDGRFADIYYKIGGNGIYKGIDLSDKAIALAAVMNSGHLNASFAVENVCDSMEREKYDCATLMEVLEHIPDEMVSSFLQGVSNCLRVGGVLFMTVPSTNLPLEQKHYRHYTKDLLSEQIKAANCGFELEELHYICPKHSMIELYKRLSMNKYWSLHIRTLDTMCYKKAYGNIARDNGKCEHVFAKIRKVQ